MAPLKPTSTSKNKHPSKPRRMRKNIKRATPEESLPRCDVPYFAHDALDPKIYPASVRQPVGGPCATNVIAQRDEEDSDCITADVSSDDGDLPVYMTSASSMKKRQFSPAPSTAEYKKVRVEGGRSAMPKKVVWDLDSDDEIIVRMKQEKRSDSDVVERLVKEGRTRYHPKTISSRWVRLKRVLAAHEDEMLDEQLTDWHEGDDDLLLDAITAADREGYQRKQKVAEEKWKMVAEYLKASKPTTNYSQNACRNRFEALENDTATIPPELDDNPEQRRAQRAEVKRKYAADLAQARAEKAITDAKAKAAAADEGLALDVPQKSKRNSKGAARCRKPTIAFPAVRKTTRSLDSSQILNEDLVDADDNAIVDEAGLSVIGVDLLQKAAPTATTNTTNAHQTYATRNSGQVLTSALAAGGKFNGIRIRSGRKMHSDEDATTCTGGPQDNVN